ncbi:MAG: HEPN domain-containing protein [Labilithrix sp.]|nr:HEPN domain-containing protein [Labilithrix sp.]MCW5815016.1 HEPN domain-containing protein [Labilithrix sp.]
MMLRDAGLFNDCLSRLYYALFHTMVALLLTVGVEPRRHRALPHLLGQHVSNVLTASEIAAVGRAATYRELADYERAWDADAEAVSEAFAEIDRLIKRARAHLVGGGWAA